MAPPSKARDPSSDQAPDFERSLAELEGLVERLEQGDLPLDEALSTFERGVALTRDCQASLQAAQQKVEILLKRSGETEIRPFSVGSDADGALIDEDPDDDLDADDA
jgi:exodeoxyribonuclease VII small subunit